MTNAARRARAGTLAAVAAVLSVAFVGYSALSPQPAQSAEFSKYRENVRWDFGGVTFITLHVVGSNNGLGRAPDGDAEFAERNKANMAWLQQAFAHAKAGNSRAIMVIQQANMFQEWAP